MKYKKMMLNLSALNVQALCKKIVIVSALTVSVLFGGSGWAEDGNNNIKTAIFAGGCFWCMEPPYDKLKGVKSTISGYSGGNSLNPTYKQISQGGTGHYEVVQVTYDASQVTYKELLDVFWVNVDPFDHKGQFCDKGEHYKGVIFYANQGEFADAEKSVGIVKKALSAKHGDKKIATKLLKAGTFYPAEDYHQDYYQKNPIRYKWYRSGCGRDKRLKQVWQSVDFTL